MALAADDKTEPATPRRRQEARRKGQVARSQDLSAAAILFVALWMLYWLGSELWLAMLAVMKACFSAESAADLSALVPLVEAIAWELAGRLGPYLLAIFGTILLVLLAQVGVLLTAQPLMPAWSKVSPLKGLQRLFSTRMLMMTVFNLGKLIVVVFIVVLTIHDRSAEILFALSLGAPEILQLGGHLAFELGMRIAAVLLVLALADFAWQRYRHERDLRMSKEEVKDEFRSMEGDPRLKARRRQVQMQMAMQRLRKDVQQADVVVTNPTHVAVAIRYEPEGMPAPKVIAKGADYVALRMRQLAGEFGVPIVQRPPLARGLYESVEVGQYVPERFYRAIAEILAYVYELTGKSAGVTA